MGYIWFTASRGGTKDLAATNNARTAIQDFLFRYPNSEKAAQARANLQQLEHKATTSSFDVARYYDKQKAYRAAVIYYNEVIQQQPGSVESEKAKKRIDEWRAKLGEKALQPLQEAVKEEEKKKEAEQKKNPEQEKPKSAEESPLAPNAAPILPPDLDSPMSPSPSTSSDTSAPPGSRSEPESSPTPEPTSTPEPTPADSATPAESAPPADSATPASADDSGSSEATASPTP